MVMLNKFLGIKYPIIQGAMANIANAEFAAAVSNCGALGVIGTGAMTVNQARDSIRKCKILTNNPFAVNVMLMNPYAGEIMEMVAEEKVPVVTTGAGSPGKYVALLKDAGAKVIPLVPSVALALRMQRIGVDAVVVEGTEAGGHVGEITTMSLVPQVADALDIPVIAAGGIADGRGFNAAISLGAIGVQLGTCLLIAEECPVHENYKQAVINAKDTDTIVTGASLRAPVRILKNKMSREYIKLENEAENREELEKLTLGALKKAVFEGDMKMGSVMIGQIAGMCKEKKPLIKIFEDIINDSKVQLEELQKRLKEI